MTPHCLNETTQPETVVESRKRPRFLMRDELQATFAGAPAIIVNISAEGMALRHDTMIKVGSSGLIQIEGEENPSNVSFRGRVRWSHISRTKSPTGGLLYDSGIEIADASDAVAGLLGRLIRAHGERDTESMQRKQQVAEQKAMSRATLPTAPAAPARVITRDQILLIREASRTITSTPDESRRLSERARQSLATNLAPGQHRNDILAIWQYLGGTIELDVITAVLEAQNI